ncbi:hypothetical protein [Labedaea rhizosphaerae]|uniref:Uncharacterized protein n=1 Tax=Labedaea rhizosphaerae TaxID=598644 RepID=A0A4R6SI20_LABRH|nr:hypothetical protein [Labedaea rhizosphaerae]TDQ01230.1 hypothetical protein EV186_1021098 [Labedaea rhizosphaerae]
MSDGAANGESPGPPPVRRVEPPVHVWVDLAKLFPRGPHEDYQNVPNGVNTQAEVPAMLSEWVRRADGAWLGKVTFAIYTRDDVWSVTTTQYCPAHCLKQKGRRERTRLDDTRLDGTPVDRDLR